MYENDWEDVANIWNRNWDDMEVDRTPSNIRPKRGRSSSRTPAARKRTDRAPSRGRSMQPRKLTFSSVRTRSRSRSSGYEAAKRWRAAGVAKAMMTPEDKFYV